MGYGISVAKKGCDVIKGRPKKEMPPDALIKERKTDHIVWTLALPYVKGAKKQLNRYTEVAKELHQYNAVDSVLDCLHEISCLFEDLAGIQKYCEKSGSESHSLSDLIIVIRNHIRHDIRENFDEEEDERKVKRHQKLSIESHLQTEIGFYPDAVKIGNTKITTAEIQDYLDWADEKLKNVFEEAAKAGYINK